MDNLIALIFSIVSACVALASLIVALIFRRKDKKAKFEELIFSHTKAISSFIYDTYDVLTEHKFTSDSKLIEADKCLTEGFTFLDTYGRAHSNIDLIHFAVINSIDDSVNDVSFSYHLCIVITTYKKFRAGKDGQTLSDIDKTKIVNFCDSFRDFIELYAEYIHKLFYKDFLTCNRRISKERKEYEKKLLMLVDEAKAKGVYI